MALPVLATQTEDCPLKLNSYQSVRQNGIEEWFAAFFVDINQGELSSSEYVIIELKADLSALQIFGHSLEIIKRSMGYKESQN